MVIETSNGVLGDIRSRSMTIYDHDVERYLMREHAINSMSNDTPRTVFTYDSYHDILIFQLQRSSLEDHHLGCEE